MRRVRRVQRHSLSMRRQRSHLGIAAVFVVVALGLAGTGCTALTPRSGTNPPDPRSGAVPPETETIPRPGPPASGPPTPRLTAPVAGVFVTDPSISSASVGGSEPS